MLAEQESKRGVNKEGDSEKKKKNTTFHNFLRLLKTLGILLCSRRLSSRVSHRTTRKTEQPNGRESVSVGSHLRLRATCSSSPLLMDNRRTLLIRYQVGKCLRRRRRCGPCCLSDQWRARAKLIGDENPKEESAAEIQSTSRATSARVSLKGSICRYEVCVETLTSRHTSGPARK